MSIWDDIDKGQYAPQGAPQAAQGGPQSTPDVWSQIDSGAYSAPVAQRPKPKPMTEAEHEATLAGDDRPLVGFGKATVQTAGHVLDMPGKAVTNFAVNHGVTNPYAAAALGTIPDLAEDYLMGGKGQVDTLGGIASRNLSKAPVAASPYTGIAEAEQARIASVHDRAAELGLSLPQPGASGEEFNQAALQNVPAAESGIRQQLNLPQDAPLSKPFFKEMRSQLGEQGSYGVVRSEPAIKMQDDAIDAVSSLPANVLKRLRVDKKIAADGSISGEDAMDLWSDLKDRASDKWDAYGDSSLTEHKEDALELEGAADKVKQSITGHFTDTGRPDVASQLDQDAKTFAQTYSVESALKGKRLDVSKLARQYSAGAPMEGDMAVLAELGEQYPEAFKLSRIGQYQPGLIKRTAAALIPNAMTAGGAALGAGLGPLGIAGGAVGGRMVGEGISGRLMRP